MERYRRESMLEAELAKYFTSIGLSVVGCQGDSFLGVGPVEMWVKDNKNKTQAVVCDPSRGKPTIVSLAKFAEFLVQTFEEQR